MTDRKSARPAKPERRTGGAYRQADVSPAAQRSKFETTPDGEPILSPLSPPFPPDPPDPPSGSDT